MNRVLYRNDDMMIIDAKIVMDENHPQKKFTRPTCGRERKINGT